jgi:acid phosphatase
MSIMNMNKSLGCCALAFVLLSCLSCATGQAPVSTLAAITAASTAPIPWPANLPVYDHVVIVVEENKDYEQVIDNPAASYINQTLRAEGASLTRMFAEEHHSQGNYFWLFSGSNQHVGFLDRIPSHPIVAGNLGRELLDAGRTFAGYSEDLPSIGSTVSRQGLYARKHVPWISFSDLDPQITQLRFTDFPSDFANLPIVAFVIPNLVNDMHDGAVSKSVPAGDTWLKKNLDAYYQWAKANNSLLIVTFDESDQGQAGLTDPGAAQPARRNRIVTILAGAHIKPGDYAEDTGLTHVNLLRTLESMYGLNRSGAQQPKALKAGIPDDRILTDLFETVP